MELLDSSTGLPLPSERLIAYRWDVINKAFSLIDEIETDHCCCGAGIDRDKPDTWEFCGIHAKAAMLKQLLK